MRARTHHFPAGTARSSTPLELLDRSPRWYRRRTSTAAATSACWRERPLTGNFRGDLDRLELAASRLMAVAGRLYAAMQVLPWSAV